MKHTQTKFFIMFLAGILFSALSVFAATISVNTDFGGNAIQYLQNLVLTDASGTTTGVIIDGVNKKIQSDIICSTDGSNCKDISSLFTGIDTDTHLTTGQVDIMVSDNGYLTDESWNVTGNNIYYTGTYVGIGTDTPDVALEVIGNATFGGNNTGAGSYNIIAGGSYNSVICANNAIVGGSSNTISGVHSRSVIIGGYGNLIHAESNTDPEPNTQTNPMFETIINGKNNIIKNSTYATIAGGEEALISGHNGVFLWSDSSSTGFTAQKDDTFIINASGGVGIGTSNPQATLDVSGSIKLGNDSNICDASKLGTMRYRDRVIAGQQDTYYSVLDICMQDGTGQGDGERIVIKTGSLWTELEE